MSSTCFEHEDTSSGRPLYIEQTLLPTTLLITMHEKIPNRNCIYNLPPERERSVSKHVEDIRIKN